jgi:hypothetical protein
MRLKDYGRNQKQRKEYIHQNRLLITGVDVNKEKPDAGALLRYAGIFAGLPSDQHSYCDLIY